MKAQQAQRRYGDRSTMCATAILHTDSLLPGLSAAAPG
jgi:hypothetical protein